MSGVIVLKYGGSAMEDSAKVMEILREISLLVQEGFSVVLVHGGGKEISGEMDRRGLKAVFAQGFRVTDEAAMAVVERAKAAIQEAIPSRSRFIVNSPKSRLERGL